MGEGGAGEGGADDDDDDDDDEDDEGAMAVPQIIAVVCQPNSYGGRPVRAIRGHKKVRSIQ